MLNTPPAANANTIPLQRLKRSSSIGSGTAAAAAVAPLSSDVLKSRNSAAMHASTLTSNNVCIATKDHLFKEEHCGPGNQCEKLVACALGAASIEHNIAMNLDFVCTFV
eukprot:gnl/MRDRNA2_/MRDRNA2_88680_c0_seq1.p2 gnl/MRDRNA2_/MRDRNA2_88680_c0~~gnl/MRDRNA2_/MRDRNA2_88680_c0_seq1.p2  ORF type:complete len:109 (-),score=13.52 gnl/MRDRNA2_/MRDRNA2_88680_c0_seq1:32-358(-)